MQNNSAYLDGKSILVTGACGTIGEKLVQLLFEKSKAGHVCCMDNNESELFFLEQHYAKHGRGAFYLADIRDKEKLTKLMYGIDVVFHTAAFKHVILCERSPFESVQTNILGIQNLITAAGDCEVESVIFTSSDKAVNPTNVMGTSKLMGERLMTAANNIRRYHKTRFTSTRFGNVLGSRGSVIPIFKEQIKKGGPVTLTDPSMTRFIMSIDEAVRLVVDSANLACGGEVFITKMPVIRIKDLAEVMIRELAPRFGYDPADVAIKVIGSKPGEKMYEELMSQEETRRAWELERYFSVIPAYTSEAVGDKFMYPGVLSKDVSNPYVSENERPLSQDELLAFLKANDLLELEERAEEHPPERYWPDRVAAAAAPGSEDDI